MKGLLIQDLLTAGKQRNFLVVMILLMALFLMQDMLIFACAYFPLLAVFFFLKISLLGIDGKEMRFEFTLPFTRREFVLEKFLISMGASVLFGVVMILAAWILDGQNIGGYLVSIGIALVSCAVMTALFLPLTLKYGNRSMLYMSLGFAFLMVAMVSADFISLDQAAAFLMGHLWILAAAVVLLIAGSYLLSMRILARKKF